jgi:hypothetical protein
MSTTKAYATKRASKTNSLRKSNDEARKKSRRNNIGRPEFSNNKPAKNGLSFRTDFIPDVEFKLKVKEIEMSQVWLIQFLQAVGISLDIHSSKKELFELLKSFVNISWMEIKDSESLLEFIKRCSVHNDLRYYAPNSEIVKLEFQFDGSCGVTVLDLYEFEKLREYDLKSAMIFRQLYLLMYSRYATLFSGQQENFYYDEDFVFNEIIEAKYCEDDDIDALQDNEGFQSACYSHNKNSKVNEFTKFAFLEGNIQEKRLNLISKHLENGFFKRHGLAKEVQTVLEICELKLDFITISDMADYSFRINEDVIQTDEGAPVQIDELFMLVHNESVDSYHPYLSQLDEQWGNCGVAQYYSAIGDRTSITGNKDVLKIKDSMDHIQNYLEKLIRKNHGYDTD